MFAVNALGAIAVPVNFRLSADEIAFILTDSGARLLVVDATSSPVASSRPGRMRARHRLRAGS